MQRTYKVEGLTTPNSFTLWESNDHCWAKGGLPDGYFESLFNKAKSEDDFWKQNITASVECDGLGVHNSPINGVVKEVFINGEPFTP